MKMLIFAIAAGLIFTGCGKQTGLQVGTKNGLQHGKATYYNHRGGIDYKGNYVNGKREGIFTSYSNGQVHFTTNYKNGLKDGVETRHKVKFNKEVKTTNWTEGKKNGLETEYYKNDKVQSKTTYKMGVEQKQTRWYSDGPLMSKSVLIKNGTVSKSIGYHGNGKQSQLTLLDVKKDVLTTYKRWYDNGQLEQQRWYDKAGNIKRQKDWSYSGKLTASAYRDKNGKIHYKDYDNSSFGTKKKTKKTKRSTPKTVTLRCGNDDSHPSMSEVSRKTAIARGEGEGAALGFHMKSGSSLSSYQQGKNFCINSANSQGLACTYASAYVAGCISKF